METKVKKKFDAVKFMREARSKISKDIADMNYKELKNYFFKRHSRSVIFPFKSNSDINSPQLIDMRRESITEL